MKEIEERFLKESDKTGRFIVKSKVTGKKYYVEPIGNTHPSDWGDLDPATKKMTGDYGDKYDFVKINIEASNSNKSLSEQYNIRSLPTVYIVEPRYKVKKEISPYSYDSVESMRSELKRYLQKRR